LPQKRALGVGFLFRHRSVAVWKAQKKKFLGSLNELETKKENDGMEWKHSSVNSRS